MKQKEISTGRANNELPYLPEINEDIYWADNEDLHQIISENMRIERELRRFSIEHLAKLMNLSWEYVALVELGGRRPSLMFICKLCDIYGIAPNYLFLKRDCDEQACIQQVGERTKKINIADTLLSQMPDCDIDLVVAIMIDLCAKGR